MCGSHFLNLFDEGWVEDQRGIRACADRAIFILTTNAGDNAISQMSRSGKSEEEIVERIKSTLSRIRHERSSQVVFTSQLLSRMKRVLVFNPLDESALITISRITLERISHQWERKREKRITVANDVITLIGRRAHQLNAQSGGKEGGRIVRQAACRFGRTSYSGRGHPPMDTVSPVPGNPR